MNELIVLPLGVLEALFLSSDAGLQVELFDALVRT